MLFLEGCPNRDLAESRVRLAAGRLGLPVMVRTHLVSSPGEAQDLGFRGSPTLSVEGHDLFPGDRSASWTACRLYPTECGLEGAPSVTALEDALSKL